MKLALRLTLWFLVPTTLVIFTNAALRIEREHRLFEQEVRQTHRVLGRALAAGIAEAGAPADEHAAHVLRDAARDAEQRLVWQPVGTSTWDPQVARELSLHHEVFTSTPRLMQTLYPVFVAGALAGAILVEQDNHEERAYVLDTITRQVLQTAMILALCLAAGVVAGLRLVGRPVQALASHAQRVGSGDFTSRIDQRFGNELDDLARALNNMAERLSEAQQRLNVEVRQKEEMRDQLRHADRLVTVGQLSAGIAHELGTPLNVALGRAQEIVDGDVTGADARRSAGAVVAQVERMSNIIRGLLDFARPRRAAKADGDAEALFRRVAAMLSSFAAKRGVELRVQVPQPVHFVADVEQVEQVIVNLVMNGLHAMTHGGTLTLSASTIERAAPGQSTLCSWSCLRVVDQGVGIAADVRDKIFDPFFTTKEPGEGTGLGLAVTWGLVAQNGGFVTFDSEVGVGTTFEVWLRQELQG